MKRDSVHRNGPSSIGGQATPNATNGTWSGVPNGGGGSNPPPPTTGVLDSSGVQITDSSGSVIKDSSGD